MFQIAKQVEGWAKVDIVERLSQTENPEIKRWMVRQGYRDNAKQEHLAYPCATGGDLLSELKNLAPDPPLLIGTGEILYGLIEGYSRYDISDYDDGPEATSLYLAHIVTPDLTLAQLRTVVAIEHFVVDGHHTYEWEDLPEGWSEERRRDIGAKARAIIERPEWKQKVLAQLRDDDGYTFWIAAFVARAIGIDVWPYYFERQASGKGDQWHYLVGTDDAARIDQVIELAKNRIALEKVASGPGDVVLGLGAGFEHHSANEAIVQGLSRFPGKGWDFIKAALKSPVTRNRNGALRTLSAWGKETWPADAEDILRIALKVEPNDEVKAGIQKVLDGRLFDPVVRLD